MMDAEDEYEQERQENIRKNQELLLSLGLNPGKGRQNGTAIRERKRREREGSDDAYGSDSPPRISARLSSRPRMTFAPQKKKKKQQKMATRSQQKVREGTRRSARLSDSAINLQRMRDEDEDLESSVMPRAPPISSLRRLQNPLPPVTRIEDENDYEERIYDRAPLPTRDAKGNIIFENNNRHFMPNVTPEEMLRGGIFGGTAFRPFFSRVAQCPLNSEEDLREFPSQWYSGLDKAVMLTSRELDPAVNRFGVKAGQTLEDWEKNGWIRRQDPRGWWQWYFRFYLGRRSSDDARQISRFNKACGPSGRFKRSLVAKIHRAGAEYDDETITPVVRQTLFHWAYQLTKADYEAYLP